MFINLGFDATVSTTARAVVNSVAQFFESQFSDPITINISVAFGNIGSLLGKSSYGLNPYSYSQIKTALANDATSRDDVSAVSFLPATDPISGAHSWSMTPAEAKALGLIAGNGTAPDGGMTFSTTAAFDYDRSDGITSGQSDFYGVVAHEMTEVMGRELNAIGNNIATGAGYHPLDLFKYASATNPSFTGTQFGYFSVNNGFSDLNPNFNTDPNGDFGDWANSEAGDAFRAFSDRGVVNAVTTKDLVVMDAIGFTRTDDYISTTATTGQVAAGSSTTGNVNYLRDHDWIRVQLTAGVQYTIDEQGQSVGAGTLSDPFMALYNAAGQLITSDDNGGGNGNSRIVYAPTATAAYYIDAGAYVDAGTGTYRVSVSSGPVVSGSIAISDATITEGNSGSQVMTFTVTRSGGTAAFTVNFVTSNGTATTADHDYNGTSGTLSFGAGDNTPQTISVTINGDTKFEGNETFSVNLSGATNGVAISDGLGIGTISNDDAAFAAATAPLNAFTRGAGGWTDQNHYPRDVADVNGDGMADIIGFARGGVAVSLATGGGHFAAPTGEIGAFGVGAGGWTSQNEYPRELADVNGDGMADIVGFARGGVAVSLATGGGHFAAPTGEIGAFGFGAGGWTSQDEYPRMVGDVNGDGMADIVGFSRGGVAVSLATGGGHFAAPTGEIGAFGVGAGGWTSQNEYPRELADVNGDGMADIVGFARGGVAVSLATGGGHFAAPTGEIGAFGFGAGGWTSQDQYPRLLADVNGDGMADIVGFGAGGVNVALATGGGHFAAPTGEIGNYGTNAGGWTSQDLYPRTLGDVNGDGADDIIGFGQAGIYESLSNAFHIV